MTDDSRGNRRRLPHAVLAIAIFLTAVQAAAQSETPASQPHSGPVRLMPSETSAAPVPRPLETPPLAENARVPSSIEVEGLSAIDPDSVGTLGPASGGLGADLWSGTSREFIEMLLPRLPERIESPTLRDLARRLLLSVARVPLAEKGHGARTSLIAQRIERLYAVGLLDDAKTLLDASPARMRDAALFRLSVDQMVMDGNMAGACAAVSRDTQRAKDRDWQRLTVFCRLREGNAEAAAFAANVLAESPGFDDPAFLALVDRIGGTNDVRVESLPNPTPVHLAMLHDAKIPIPPDVVKSDSAAVLRLVALREDADRDTRLRAAERAAMAGALSPERLREVYMRADFAAGDVERALSISEKEQSARARALMFRAAQMQKVETAKATVLRKALESARTAGLTPLYVRVYLPMLRELPATGTLSWFAGDVTRALLSGGAVEAARPWLLMIRQRALRDDSARRLRDSLWAISVLAGEAGSAANEPAAMDAWFDTLKGAGDAAAKADLALSLMSAVGVFPPDGFSRRLLALTPVKAKTTAPPPGVLQALAQAAARRRRGEVVCLALIAFEGTSAATASAYLLGEVVKGLAAVGLIREAQALALEAASAAGL